LIHALSTSLLNFVLIMGVTIVCQFNHLNCCQFLCILWLFLDLPKISPHANKMGKPTNPNRVWKFICL
jgi:hypothetical protein